MRFSPSCTVRIGWSALFDWAEAELHAGSEQLLVREVDSARGLARLPQQRGMHSIYGCMRMRMLSLHVMPLLFSGLRPHDHDGWQRPVAG